MIIRKIFNFSVLLFLLTGCVGTSTYNYKINTKPYTVAGKTYYPMASASGFTETGEASWYGPDFHGKKTASGETYNKYAFTAAHKILPFGTRVKVTNLTNGLSTDVVINDRGPFKSGRIIDLSYSAAKQISMIGTGTARVKIKAVGSTNAGSVKNTVVNNNNNNNNYYVQVGAYSVRDNANGVAKKLSSMGYANVIRSSNGKYSVVAGPYVSKARAADVQKDLKKTYSGAFVVE